MNRLFATLCCLFSMNVWAFDDFPLQMFGDQVGNGGKVVVCRNAEEEITWIRLLDFYESEILYALTHNFEEGSHLQKARGAVQILRSVDPQRMARYSEAIDTFFDNVKFVNSPLMETPDSDHIVAPPEGCKVEQAVIQLKPNFPSDRLYTINQNLWNHLDSDNQAGLILHEIIYFGAIPRGHQNSIGVRYFNAHVSSGVLTQISQYEYDELLLLTKLYTHRWTDVDTGYEWSFMAGVAPTWNKARIACRDVEKSSLPEPRIVEASANRLLTSQISLFVSENLFGETWSSYRRSGDGRIAINLWSESAIDRHYRQSNDVANIICLNLNPIGGEL
jgi:hypothetical protein